MINRIDGVSSGRSSFLRNWARALREEGDFFGATRVARLVALAAGVCCTHGCSSPEPQNGTNTNWACRVDEDCKEMSADATCQARRCTSSPVPGAVLNVPGEIATIVATDSGFVAAGASEDHTLVLSSQDGHTWVRADAPIEDGYFFASAFESGTLLLAGQTPVEGPYRTWARSPGGVWQSHDFGWGSLEIYSGNGVFLANPIGEPGVLNQISSDGTHWVDGTLPGGRLAFADGKFITFRSRTVLPGPEYQPPILEFQSSADGFSWSTPALAVEPV